jgi:chemotaxis protein methyltransferase CheR
MRSSEGGTMADGDLMLDARSFQRITRLMFDTIGLALNDDKRSLVMSRLGPRIKRIGLSSFSDYADLIEDESQGVEFQFAVDLLTTHETYFFREPLHFELLEKDLMAQPQRYPLKLWSAACSFGDEAYSMAMILADLQTRGYCVPGWSVIGSDISERVLLTAKQGVFPEDRMRLVPEERLRKYCLRGEGPAAGQMMVHRSLRQSITFGLLNLTQPFGSMGVFDVIMLRNVLIYFDMPTRAAVIERVIDCLRPGGLFFVGTSESRIQGGNELESIATGVFRKRGRLG